MRMMHFPERDKDHIRHVLLTEERFYVHLTGRKVSFVLFASNHRKCTLGQCTETLLYKTYIPSAGRCALRYNLR
jgi:hypothetical protein